MLLDTTSGSLAGNARRRTRRLASALAARANLIGFGKTPVSEPGKRVRELDRDQAADSLRMAIARGFKDIERIQRNPDFEEIVKRDDLTRMMHRGIGSPIGQAPALNRIGSLPGRTDNARRDARRPNSR